MKQHREPRSALQQGVLALALFALTSAVQASEAAKPVLAVLKFQDDVETRKYPSDAESYEEEAEPQRAR